MSQENKEMLIRIYNTMSLISTKGEDTLIMADCLRAVKQLSEQPECENCNCKEGE